MAAILQIRRLMKRITLKISAICVALTLAACGGGFTGTYSRQSLSSPTPSFTPGPVTPTSAITATPAAATTAAPVVSAAPATTAAP